MAAGGKASSSSVSMCSAPGRSLRTTSKMTGPTSSDSDAIGHAPWRSSTLHTSRRPRRMAARKGNIPVSGQLFFRSILCCLIFSSICTSAYLNADASTRLPIIWINKVTVDSDVVGEAGARRAAGAAAAAAFSGAAVVRTAADCVHCWRAGSVKTRVRASTTTKQWTMRGNNAPTAASRNAVTRNISCGPRRRCAEPPRKLG